MNWIEILKEYKEVIATIFTALLVLIVGLINKRKNGKLENFLDVILKDVYEVLPGLVEKVEAPGNGSTKKNMVLVLVQQYLFKKYKFLDFEKIEQQVVTQIEAILQAPTKSKKEVI